MKLSIWALAIAALGMSGVLAGQRVDFAPGGVLRWKNAAGRLTIHGWNRAEAQITGKVQIPTEHNGNELVVSPDRRSDGEYNVRVPRDTQVIIEGGSAEVYVTDVTGDLQVTLRRGGITFTVPAGREYSVDARTTFGSVNADLETKSTHGLWFPGEKLMYQAPGAAHKASLRVWSGDILILKTLAAAPSLAY